MAAKTLHLKIEQGATFGAIITLQQPGGAPVDLSGFIARSQMRQSADSSTAAANFTMVILSPLNAGRISMALPAQETALISAGRYVYDVEIESGGVVDRVLEGIVTVSGGVTR